MTEDVTYLINHTTEFFRVRFIAHASGIAKASLIVMAGIVGYYLTATLIRKILLKSRVQDAFARILVDNVYKTIAVVTTIILAANQLGINITAPLAGLGIAGLAIGFAAQDSLSNIIAGFLIFFDKPFRVGDHITLGDYYGRIERITMRSTRIRTQDNTYVVIPNQKIINDILVDHTTNGDTRIIVPVSIGYDASIDAAREAILSQVSGIEGVVQSPAPDVVVNSLSDSGVNLLVRVWIKDASIERRTFFKTVETTKRALDAAGISIPYPHIKVVK
ncbi:MAG: mechanosensitive ion channel family protein [Candidatus Paceibacterota bacterium]